MNQLSREEELMVRYLLGDLPEDAQVQIEQHFLSDDNFFELLSAAEDELRYDYALGHLSARERELFEKRFVQSPQDRAGVDFASALMTKLAALESSEPRAVDRAQHQSEKQSFWAALRAFF